MNSLKQYVKNDVIKKKQYFQVASPEIARQNLADKALYTAKERGKNFHCLLDT